MRDVVFAVCWGKAGRMRVRRKKTSVCDEKRVKEEEEWMRTVFTSSPSPLPVCVVVSCGLDEGGDPERVRKQGKFSNPAGVPPPARYPSALQPMAQ